MEDLDKEYWKKIEDYDYLISTEGRVKNKDGIFMNGGINSKTGYRYVILSIGKKKYNLKIHRLVALAFIPNPNNLPMVNHINKNRLENSVSNLEWCTTLYNNQSINTIKNIGYVYQRPTGNWQAKITYYKQKYQFSNPNEDKCIDWLYARRIEIKYGLNLTEV
jgi:hypothetical protein